MIAHENSKNYRSTSTSSNLGTDQFGKRSHNRLQASRASTVWWRQSDNVGGAPQDIAVPADYDGDGKTDIAVYRSGDWFILRSSDGGMTSVGWGITQDVPVPADYDGDGKADIAVYRDGIWFIRHSSAVAPLTVRWGGLPQDIPLPGDFDGDGKADVAIYRDGMWVFFPSSNTACEGCWDYD